LAATSDVSLETYCILVKAQRASQEEVAVVWTMMDWAWQQQQKWVVVEVVVAFAVKQWGH
jgi:hypothetical protein